MLEVNRSFLGKTACIVGLGGIGDLLIGRLRGFGMILTGVDNYSEHAPNGVKGYQRQLELTKLFDNAGVRNDGGDRWSGTGTRPVDSPGGR